MSLRRTLMVTMLASPIGVSMASEVRQGGLEKTENKSSSINRRNAKIVWSYTPNVPPTKSWARRHTLMYGYMFNKTLGILTHLVVTL